MFGKGQWAKDLTGLRLSLLRLKEERDRQPQWLGYYSYSNLNSDTLTIATMSVMQYFRALECLIREVVIANPALKPVHILKTDFSDGFYHIGLRPIDAPKVGLVFATHIFTLMETVADIVNAALLSNTSTLLHRLYYLAESIVMK